MGSDYPISYKQVNVLAKTAKVQMQQLQKRFDQYSELQEALPPDAAVGAGIPRSQAYAAAIVFKHYNEMFAFVRAQHAMSSQIGSWRWQQALWTGMEIDITNALRACVNDADIIEQALKALFQDILDHGPQVTIDPQPPPKKSHHKKKVV